MCVCEILCMALTNATEGHSDSSSLRLGIPCEASILGCVLSICWIQMTVQILRVKL